MLASRVGEIGTKLKQTEVDSGSKKGVGDQTGEDCLLTWVDGEKVPDRRELKSRFKKLRSLKPK